MIINALPTLLKAFTNGLAREIRGVGQFDRIFHRAPENGQHDHLAKARRFLKSAGSRSGGFANLVWTSFLDGSRVPSMVA